MDDDLEICKSIQLLMKDTGVFVDTALRGEDAVRMVCEASAAENAYQMILLDWKMPGMDGIQTAEKIREVVPEPVPILFLTAYDGEEIHEEVLRTENIGILVKPFFVSAFKEKILEMQSQKEEVKHTRAADERINLDGLHFLVAEDNEINAEILSELLDLEGAVCEIVENGQLAVERFGCAQAGEFDAILMDVQMPVMNGYEATRAIRALPRRDAGKSPLLR